MLRKETIEKSLISKETDSFDPNGSPVFPTETFSLEELSKMRDRAIRDFYFRPSYLLNRATRLKSLSQLRAQTAAGISVIRRIIFS